MSKRTNQSDWQPEIDASYEQHVNSLANMAGSVNDYALEPARPQRAQQPKTWVPEVRPQQAPVVARRIIEPIDINMPQQSTMTVDVRTSAVDRARGFTIETHQLGLIVGVLAVLVAVVGRGQPLLTLGTLFTFGLWYTLIWLAAWLIHRFISPEGIAAFNAVMSWVYIFRRG